MSRFYTKLTTITVYSLRKVLAFLAREERVYFAERNYVIRTLVSTRERARDFSVEIDSHFVTLIS